MGATPNEAYGRQGEITQLKARHYLVLNNDSRKNKKYTFYIKLECENVKVEKTYSLVLVPNDWAFYDINLYLNFMPPYRNTEYKINAYTELSGGESKNIYNYSILHA